METDSSPKLEYNLASSLTLTVRERDFRQLCEELVNSGYRYACALPFRSLTENPLGFPFLRGKGIENLKDCPIRIVHLEEAWNPTDEKNIAKAVVAGLLHKRKLFGNIEKDFPPQWWDGVFPKGVTCNRLFEEMYNWIPGVKVISHSFDVNFPSDRMLVEINPGVELSPSEILDVSRQRGIGLVFDPSRLLVSDRIISVPGQPTRPYKGEWEKQFVAFSDQIRVVDINPPGPADKDDLLEGKGVLKELAQAAKETGKVEFLRVEIPIPLKWQIPGLPSRQEGFDFLWEIGGRLMEG